MLTVSCSPLSGLALNNYQIGNSLNKCLKPNVPNNLSKSNQEVTYSSCKYQQSKCTYSVSYIPYCSFNQNQSFNWYFPVQSSCDK